jgi:hypothetical protein
MQQAALLEAKPSSAKPSSSKRPAADRRSRAKSQLVWMIVLAGLLGAGTLAVRGLMDDSPKGCVRRFTCNRLAGDWNEAEAYMPDGAVQRFEFERWRVRCFSSILDKHRPKGDTAAIEIEAISGTPRAGVFRVVMTSPSIGRRVHQQHREKIDGRWLFDAADTVRSHDRPEQSWAISAPEPHASRQWTRAARSHGRKLA